MQVTVKLYSVFRLEYEGYDSTEGIRLQITNESTLADLLGSLNIAPQRVSLVCVNKSIVQAFDVYLKDKDVIEIFPFFGGG